MRAIKSVFHIDQNEDPFCGFEIPPLERGDLVRIRMQHYEVMYKQYDLNSEYMRYWVTRAEETDPVLRSIEMAWPNTLDEDDLVC